MHHTSRLRGGARAPIVLLLVIFAAGYSSAWSAFTREYFCRKSVERVWGFEEMLGCIPYGEYGRLVGDKIRILYPPEELGKDHTSCPIVRGDDSLWVCGNSSLNPTGNLAEIWFNKSRDSKTLCERVVGN